MRPDLWKAVLGGVVGTTAMTAMMYALAPFVMNHPPDIATMLDSAPYWLAAIFLHFINGSITLPLAYAYLGFRVLPGQPWLRGAMWGLILWVLAELLVMPLMGAGLFSAGSGRMAIAAAIILLFGHLAYGTLLGWVARGTSERSERLPEARRLAA